VYLSGIREKENKWWRPLDPLDSSNIFLMACWVPGAILSLLYRPTAHACVAHCNVPGTFSLIELPDSSSGQPNDVTSHFVFRPILFLFP